MQRKCRDDETDGKPRMKQTRAAICLLLALLCAFAFSTRASASAAEMGDLNEDGVLSAADAALLLRRYPTDLSAGTARSDWDLTGNGMINKTDVRAMLLYAAGGIADLEMFRERVSTGLCDERLFERFCYTGTQDDLSGGYRSENVNISISSGVVENSSYSLADIYVQDISCITTAFSQGEFRGSTATVQEMFRSVDGGIIAMNGDFYSLHVYGPVIRNGVVYADHVTRDWDIAVLLLSGELLTYEYRTLTKDVLASMSVYQTWVFGPSLLDAEGKAKTKFRSAVQPANPRSVIGYFEPGHYAFLTVDGRTNESQGLTMQQLSQLCEDLGFVRAYNLDGGRSSILLSSGGLINSPYRGGRPSSDIVAVRELPENLTEQE